MENNELNIQSVSENTAVTKKHPSVRKRIRRLVRLSLILCAVSLCAIGYSHYIVNQKVVSVLSGVVTANAAETDASRLQTRGAVYNITFDGDSVQLTESTVKIGDGYTVCIPQAESIEYDGENIRFSDGTAEYTVVYKATRISARTTVSSSKNDGTGYAATSCIVPVSDGYAIVVSAEYPRDADKDTIDASVECIADSIGVYSGISETTVQERKIEGGISCIADGVISLEGDHVALVPSLYSDPSGAGFKNTVNIDDLTLYYGTYATEDGYTAYFTNINGKNIAILADSTDSIETVMNQ